MKKIILIIIFLASAICYGQKKEKLAGEIGLNMSKDSVIVITLTREEVGNLIKAIDANIDSKRTSKEIVDFLLRNAVLVPKKEK